MLENETIICISPSSWFSLWRNRQQIMSRLSQKNRLVFLEPQKKLLPFFKNILKEYKLLLNIQPIKINANLEVFNSPPSLPLLGHILPKILLKVYIPLIIKINNIIFKNHINRLIQHLKIKKPIIFYYNPFHAELLGTFNEKLKIYYVYDELAQYPHNKRINDTLEHYDNLLCKKADIIFSSSNDQYIKRKQLNKKTYLIRNAVDFDHFNKALDKNLWLPDDMKNIPPPIIGYAGFLGFQIDVNLLLEIVKIHPKWSLVLVGPEGLPKNKNYYKLKSMNNVFFLGNKDVNVLPNYLKIFDVGIMPYNINTHVVTSFPLKCFEYLAAGKPTVSVNLPMLNDLEEIVKLADTPQEFIFHIEEFLKRKSDEVIKKGIEEARKNTWDNRIAELSGHVFNLLQEQRSSC